MLAWVLEGPSLPLSRLSLSCLTKHWTLPHFLNAHTKMLLNSCNFHPQSWLHRKTEGRN